MFWATVKCELGFRSVCCWKVDTAGSWMVVLTMHYSTENLRCRITSLLLKNVKLSLKCTMSGAGPARIARRLNRSPSTISRELNRNSDSAGYRAVVAQEQTSLRRRKRPLIRKMDDPFINESVRTGLSQEWSPEEIAGRMKGDYRRTLSRCVSYQTIYRWLETCEHRRHFRSFLRHGRYRKRRGTDGRGRIRNRVSIEQRPARVDSRRQRTSVPQHSAKAASDTDCRQRQGVCVP